MLAFQSRVLHFTFETASVYIHPLLVTRYLIFMRVSFLLSPEFRPKADWHEALEKGEPIPDEIILRLVDARLRQSDCRVNGWVLDGFPENEAQVNLLRAMRIQPSLVVIFEQPVEESVRRLMNKRIDPQTGITYNTEVNPPKSEIVNSRLVQQKEDQESNVRKRYVAWNSNISNLEEAYKNVLLSCPSDKMIESIAD